MHARLAIAALVALVCVPVPPVRAQDAVRGDAPPADGVAAVDGTPAQPGHIDARPKPWPAPVGHRQPRPADLPANAPSKDDADVALERLQRALDGRLNICRRC